MVVPRQLMIAPMPSNLIVLTAVASVSHLRSQYDVRATGRLTPTHVNVFVLLFIIFVDSEGNGIVRNANVNADQKLGASIHIKEMKLPVNV